MSIWEKHNDYPELSGARLQISGTLEIGYRIAELRSRGMKIYDFGTGASPAPIPDVMVRELSKRAEEKDYFHPRGLELLRNTVSEYYQQRDSVYLDPDLMIMGPGLKELLFLVQYAFNLEYGKNWELILPTPCWGSYIEQALLLETPVQYIHTNFEDNWKLKASSFQKVCETKSQKPRLLILNSPGNPTGLVYNINELEELAYVARKYQVAIVSDEIYARMNHTGDHHSIAKFYPDLTIHATGLSKWCGAAGWRLGIMTFPKQFKHILEKRMYPLASLTYTCSMTPVQYAAVKAFTLTEGGMHEIVDYLRGHRRILASLGKECYKVFSKNGIRLHAPEAAYYLFLDFSPLRQKLKQKGIEDDYKLREVILYETGAALVPGSVFGTSRENLTLRLSYVNYDARPAMIESRSISEPEFNIDFLQKYCGQTLEGCQKIADWSKSL